MNNVGVASGVGSCVETPGSMCKHQPLHVDRLRQRTCIACVQKKSTRLKRSGQSGSVDPEDQPVKKTRKRKAEVNVL